MKWQCKCQYILYIDMVLTAVFCQGDNIANGSLEKTGSSYALYLTFIDLHEILKILGSLI